MPHPVRLAALTLLAALATACSDDDGNDPAPGGGDEPVAVALDSVVILPRSNAHPGGIITATFSGPMQDGMEAFVDLHEGAVAGPVVPLTCVWSTDDVTLICVPGAALTPVPHTLHLGAALRAADGSVVDLTPGLGLGGTWMTGDMTTMHQGGMTGDGWQDAAGHMGMLFTFTPE